MPENRTVTVNVGVDVEKVEELNRKIERVIERIEPMRRATDKVWKLREAWLNGSGYEFYLMPEKEYEWFLRLAHRVLRNEVEIHKHKSVTREGYLLVEVYL